MATVDAYVPINMLTGYDFSVLEDYGIYYEGSSSWLEIDAYDGSYATFYGYGFTYDYFGPTGSGTVTDYEVVDASGYLMGGYYDVNISAGSILNAASTSSTADDFNVIKTALAGADTIYGSDYADVLDGFNGNDKVYGYAGNDTIYGEAGNDYLSGMTGNDKLNGGTGNDSMNGGSGNDYLYGGAGNDRLTGSTGRDSFVFNSKLSATTNVDTITDYSVANDTILLDNAVMSALGRAMESGEFWKSTSGRAHDSSDHIIYETDTGKLFYDSNGSAAGGSTHIATLGANLALTYADFLVI